MVRKRDKYRWSERKQHKFCMQYFRRLNESKSWLEDVAWFLPEDCLFYLNRPQAGASSKSSIRALLLTRYETVAGTTNPELRSKINGTVCDQEEEAKMDEERIQELEEEVQQNKLCNAEGQRDADSANSEGEQNE